MKTIAKIIKDCHLNRTNIILFYGLLFISIIFIISLFWRFPNGDEGILAEQAYWLQKVGYVKSPLFTELGFGWEAIQYHYHKLFIIFGALITKLFGVDLYLLRLFVLVCSLSLCYFLFKYQVNELKSGTTALLLFPLLLLFQYHFFYFSFIYRPEIPVATLGFISFYFLNSFINTGRSRYLYISAFLAGCSALMHLNGLVFIGAGGMLLLIERKWKNAVTFWVVSSLTALLYFFNITNREALDAFLFQFTNDPNLTEDDFSILLKLGKLLSEHSRYFHSPKEIAVSILFFFSIASNFKALWKNNRQLITYALLTMFFIAVIAHDKTDKYSTIYIPFWLLIIVQSIMLGYKSVKWQRIAFRILIVFYIIVNSFFIGQTIVSGYDVVGRNERYASLMPHKGATVITRENFFFNEYNNYKIVSLLSFEIRWKRENITAYKDKNLFIFARKIGAKYILLETESYNRGVLKTINFENLHENDVIFNYLIKHKSDEAILFEALPKQ